MKPSKKKKFQERCNSIFLFHFFRRRKKRNPKKGRRRTCLAKNQLRSAKGVEVPHYRNVSIFVLGTNAFYTLHYVDFFDANQLSRKVVQTKTIVQYHNSPIHYYIMYNPRIKDYELRVMDYYNP